MVFGFLNKIKDSVISGAKSCSNKIKSAYKSVVSKVKTVCTTVKNECKKAATKVKNKWNKTPLWGKIAIGAVAGAAIGIGAVVAGPAILGATSLATGATVGTTTATGGLIAYLLHSEIVKTDNDEPAPQQHQNKRTNEDKNRQKNTKSNKNRNQNHTNKRNDYMRNRESYAVSKKDQENRSIEHEERNTHLEESYTFRGDYFKDEDIELQRALEQSIQRDKQLEEANIKLAKALSLSEAQQNEQHDNDLQNAIALSLSENQNLVSTDLKSDSYINNNLENNSNAMSEEQVEFQLAIYKSLQIYNSESDYQEAVALSLFTAMTEEEGQESINTEIAIHESIISYLEKFEIETKETCTIQKLIESTNIEVNQTIEGLDNEHEAMKLLKEALEYLDKGKIYEQHERISQALRCFTNASQRLDTAASLKRLNIILETAHQVIESLAQIEAYDEVVEFCKKLKKNFPEFAHLFDRIEEQIQNGQWIGNFDDIVNKNEQSENNVVQLLSAPGNC